MQIIQLGRQRGKTVQMVQWLKKTPGAVLLVINNAERSRILEQFFTEEERMTYADKIHTPGVYNNRGQHRRVIGIDNLDLVLSAMFGVPVEVASVTRDE